MAAMPTAFSPPVQLFAVFLPSYPKRHKTNFHNVTSRLSAGSYSSFLCILAYDTLLPILFFPSGSPAHELRLTYPYPLLPAPSNFFFPFFRQKHSTAFAYTMAPLFRLPRVSCYLTFSQFFVLSSRLVTRRSSWRAFQTLKFSLDSVGLSGILAEGSTLTTSLCD